MKTSDQLTLGCVILAAGNSTRFGNNKLLVEIDGKMMIERALEAIPAERFSAVAVEKSLLNFGDFSPFNIIICIVILLS